jgi:hypothetical protein
VTVPPAAPICETLKSSKGADGDVNDVTCKILNTVGSSSFIIFTIDPVDNVLKYVPKSMVG